MKTTLKSITRFEAVAPGATVSQPHGINKNDGAKVVPDEIKRRTEGLFLVTADDTNVTVTNKGATEADIDVLAERWHSIDRQLGKSDYGASSLVIQPWETEGVAADDEIIPLTAVVWSQDNPGGSFGNVFDNWLDAYNACKSVAPAQGSVFLFVDSRYSADFLITDGTRVSVVPLGVWDMEGIIPIHERLGDDDGHRAQVGWAEDAFWDNFETARGRNLIFVQRSGIATSPIRLGVVDKDTSLAIEGFGVIFRQEDATPAPLIKCNDPSQLVEIKGGGDSTFCSLGKPGFDSPSPVLDVNGQFVKLGSGGLQIQNNTPVDSLGTGKVQLAAYDDAAMVGGIAGGGFLGNDYDFPAIPADTTQFFGNTFSRNRVMPTTVPNVDGIPVLDVKTANYQAMLGELVPCDTIYGGFTVTLPRAAPGIGELVIVTDVTGNAKTGKEITVAAAANDRNPGGVPDTIQGQSGPVVISVARASLQFRSSGQGNWMIV